MSTSHSASPESKINRVPAAPPEVAAAHFHARFTFEADVSDVHADLEAGITGFVVVDTRSDEAWAQGHIPGAVHLPTDQIARRAPGLIDRDTLVVTYCWGPGCNGATRGAYAFAQLGYRVKEMLGGYEYWVREGFTTESATGRHQAAVDPLTAPAAAVDCGC